MSNENVNESAETSGDGGEDLNNALSAQGDTAYITTDEKKSPNTSYVILVALLLIGPAVVWYMYNRKGPDAASASELSIPVANQTVNEFLQTGPDGIKMMREMLHSTEKIVKEFLEYPSMTQIPLSDLKTNPFSASIAKNDGAGGDKRRREEERQAILRAVQTLQLQSIMSGTHKACMINNTMCEEGEQIGQFIVEKISTGSVIVKSATYRFELKMQK